MPHKKQILLLHGALGSKAQFQDLSKVLSGDFEVLDLNFSGHGGKSFNPAGFGIEVFSEEVLHFLDQQNIDKISIFGYSMGGYVALWLALQHPMVIDKIYTLGTKFAWTPEAAAKEIKMLNPEIIAAKVPAFASALEKRHAPHDWKNVLEKTAQMMLELGNGTAIPWDQFSEIVHPVSIGLGSLDHMVSREESEKVAEQLPNGQLYIFEGFKHPIEQIDDQRLGAALINFF